MNDAEFIFKQDSKDKKRIASNAAKRVGKSSKMTMPYELMTGKERREYMQASEVSVFKLRPMTLDEFKKVEGDKQLELLKWYGEKYGWSANGVAYGLDTTYATGAKLLEQFMLTAMFKARMKEATKEQKAQVVANRKELEELRKPQEAPKPPECEFTQPKEEKPVQAAPERNFGGLKISFTGDKFGRTLRKQLEGIAASLDEGEVFRVELSIVELSSYGNEGVGDIANA